MNISEEMRDGVLLFRPAGRLDSTTSPELEKSLLARLQENPRVVIDLTELEYISSAGLRVVLMAAKRTKQAGGRLVLCGLSDAIREVFSVSGFLKILESTEGCEAALQQASGA